MSGLSNEPRSSGHFVNIKKGVLYNDGNPFTHLTGDLIDIDICDDSYENKPYRKLTLFIQDDEEKVWLLPMSLSSGYGMAFFRMSKNIDPAKPIKISAGFEESQDKKTGYGKLFIQQEKKYIQHAFKKDSPEYKKMPGAKEHNIGTAKKPNIVKDYSEQTEFMELVIAELYKKVLKTWPNGADKKSKAAARKEQVEQEPTNDKLPWE